MHSATRQDLDFLEQHLSNCCIRAAVKTELQLQATSSMLLKYIFGQMADHKD